MSRSVEVVEGGLGRGTASMLSPCFRDDATWTRTGAEVQAFFEPDYTIAWIAHGQRVIEASGLDDSRRGWLDWLEPWETYHVQIERIVSVADKVVVLTRLHGRLAATQNEVEMLGGSVYLVRNGRGCPRRALRRPPPKPSKPRAAGVGDVDRERGSLSDGAGSQPSRSDFPSLRFRPARVQPLHAVSQAGADPLTVEFAPTSEALLQRAESRRHYEAPFPRRPRRSRSLPRSRPPPACRRRAGGSTRRPLRRTAFRCCRPTPCRARSRCGTRRDGRSWPTLVAASAS